MINLCNDCGKTWWAGTGPLNEDKDEDLCDKCIDRRDNPR